MSNLSAHAQIRMQQRCIPTTVVNWLLMYGDEQPDNRGGVRLFFGSNAKRQLKHEPAPFEVCQKLLRVYIVVLPQTGLVITTGYLQRKRLSKAQRCCTLATLSNAVENINQTISR